MSDFNIVANGEPGRFVDWVFGKSGALFRAAANGRVDMVNELMSDGADINVTSGKGFTPLHRAAQNGHIDMVRFLIEHGAETGACAHDDSTPIALATRNGHDEIARLLESQDT